MRAQSARVRLDGEEGSGVACQHPKTREGVRLNDPDVADSNGPFRGIKRSLTEGGIRVPFIAWWPGVVPAASVEEAPVHFQDLFATAGALAPPRSACAHQRGRATGP